MEIPECRVSNIFKEEIERAKLCYQCSPKANGLYSDFRFDHVYQSYLYFSERGLSFQKLFELQNKIPIIYPWNIEYDSLRQVVNRRYNIFPMMIVMAETDSDVLMALKISKNYNIPLRLRGGSHNFEGQSISEGLVIDQSRRKFLQVIWESNGKAKIPYLYMEAGCLLGPISDYLAQYGLVMICGSCCNNGAAGFLLGGGIGYLSRKYGLGSDSLVELKAILADGTSIISNSRENSDFLVGSSGAGGGNFGIITGMKVRLYYIPEVTIFKYVLSFDNVKQLLRSWQEWFPTSSSGFMTQVSFNNNSSELHLQGIYCGTLEEKEVEFELNKVVKDCNNIKKLVKKVSYLESAKFFGGNGRWLLHFKAKSAMIYRPLPEEALEIIEKYMRMGDGTDIFEITSLGGKIAKSNSLGYSHQGALAWMMINTHWSRQSQTEKKLRWVRSFYEKLSPYLCDLNGKIHVYANIPDLDLENPLEAYYSDNLSQLTKIKKKYDPENIFSYEQSIPPL